MVGERVAALRLRITFKSDSLKFCPCWTVTERHSVNAALQSGSKLSLRALAASQLVVFCVAPGVTDNYILAISLPFFTRASR